MPFYDKRPEELAKYHGKVSDPADFDAFWGDTINEARALPINARFEPYDYGLSLMDVFDVSFSGFDGHEIRGWYIQPVGGASSCVVKYHGYNGGRGMPHEHLKWPATGRAVLVMDTRGQGAGWASGATGDPVGSGPAHAGYMTRGISDPKSYFYRRVFTDAVRALDAVRTRADIDPGKIAVAGGSQGGAISLAAAALDGNVACAMPDVPFLCDMPRAIGLAPRDPYGEVARYLAIHHDHEEMVLKTLSYFDGVNFAKRAKMPSLFSVAMMDTICPPSTVYAAYNSYAGEKSIEVYKYNDHEGGAAVQQHRKLRWLAQHL
ncbi:MAG: acetylxylan esterase [Marinosulfonomonas sp.]